VVFDGAPAHDQPVSSSTTHSIPRHGPVNFGDGLVLITGSSTITIDVAGGGTASALEAADYWLSKRGVAGLTVSWLVRYAVWVRCAQGGGVTAERWAFREQLRMQAAE